MKLTYEGLKDTAAWEKADIALPKFDVEEVAAKTKENPVWVHFGAGNIFRGNCSCRRHYDTSVVR